MIRTLNNRNKQIAKWILAIQITAYEIEADLIGFHGIPQLSDTVGEIMASQETFVGFMLDKEIVGLISYVETELEVDICRLVVKPKYFRKGIAKSLLLEIIHCANGRRLLVSTGSKNHPAIKLYEKLGFEKNDEVEVAEGIYISQFARIG
ncbi:GNAT family N-acetyltransferase [Oceanobacillus arenosus]|uniref:GNAT family N-acetyltransferase n=1 Tax=Oceanobacillus arenosus TaxID=1229153 RepID=A0A3D8PZ69_9BACI|nr:GNAT family N-acetyltransferase [Oceanobacillus arenosus]RDW21102.1 GNAT family N-acetyltransferase [Oceanobacillus arenosus]